VVPPPRTRRLIQLYAGLVLFGVSDAMLLMAALGVDPWDVLHQGLSRRFGLGVGTWAVLVGAVVMLLWIPLRQRPGLGTISNVVVVGLVIDLVLALIPSVHGLGLRVAVLVSAVFLNGVATGAYIGAGLGPGPRDGLLVGWLLGGNVGVGTVLYAASIGPIAHVFIPLFQVSSTEPGRELASSTDVAWRQAE